LAKLCNSSISHHEVSALVDLFVKYFNKIITAFQTNNFYVKLLQHFANTWIYDCGVDNIYTRTYPIYCIQYIKTPIQYSHV